MKIIIYKTIDNGVVEVIPAKDYENKLEELAKIIVPVNQPWNIVDSESIVEDNSFRDAWEYNSDTISININKVKNIIKNRWRIARDKKFKELDVEFMRAVETNNTAVQQEIISKKQALRDVTKIELPGDTVDQIKNIWPKILN